MTQKKARAKLVDDHWIVTAPPHIMVRIKRVLRGVDGRALGTVMLSDTLDNCRDLEWFAQRYPIEIMHRDYLERRAQAHRDQEELLELVLSKSYKPRRFKLAVPPRKYQRQGAELALASGGLLLADELGVGKTATAIAMLSDPVTRPALVVVPANLQTQWKAEIAKFAPSLKVHIVERLEPYDPGSQDVYVMSYNKLHRWAEVLEPVINSAVYDEVHELRRGYQSKKGTAALFLADKVKFRLGLSATPIFNYGGEIFWVLEALRPGAVGTEFEFSREWCAHDGIGRKSRLKDPASFGSYLRSIGLMLRRTRKDVRRELPPLIKAPQSIDCDVAALHAIEEPAGELARIILGLSERELDATERYYAGGRLDALVRQATGISKAPYVAEFTRMVLEAGERVVLCGWHHAVYGLWREKLKGYEPAFYTGKESIKQKNEAQRRFVDRETPLLIMSLRSGAGLDGLQYSKCTTVIHGELDWSPAVHEQLNARLHRDGQKEPVVAYYLIGEDGSDPIVANVLGLKRAQLIGVLDPSGKDTFGTHDTGGAQVVELARRYLRRDKRRPTEKRRDTMAVQP